jgi:hypothetical protein
MSYKKRFQAYPEIVEEIATLLRHKHIPWGINNQMNDKRGDEIEGTINVPFGEATLTVETSDRYLKKDLNDLISRLEKVHDPSHDDPVIVPPTVPEAFGMGLAQILFALSFRTGGASAILTNATGHWSQSTRTNDRRGPKQVVNLDLLATDPS